jgi:Holliday junction resolvase RusA-like endonuclease
MSARTETLFIPWIGPSANELWAGTSSKKAWGKRKRIADEGHAFVGLYAKKIKPFSGKVALSFQAIHGKGSTRRDLTNYHPVIKIIEDGLVRGGIIKSDSFKTVVKITIEPPLRGKESGVIVTISEEQ